ncbi:MAG TPA: hypothetical protein PL072_10610 [Phycisphaerales bacterium]|nr:hypothetical protein [Phycisphaerales bacterium]
MNAKKTGTKTRSAKARRMAAAAEAIRQRLGLETLADRQRDALEPTSIAALQAPRRAERPVDAAISDLKVVRPYG